MRSALLIGLVLFVLSFLAVSLATAPNSSGLCVGGADAGQPCICSPCYLAGGSCDVDTCTGGELDGEACTPTDCESGGGFCQAIDVILIDIKPGSDPNCFNANGHGVIPVAILGSDSFDVTTIDQTTLLFGGLEVRVRGNKGPLCHLEDSNADGKLDLVCQFEDNADYWDPGDGDATLTGNLYDSTEFEGTDSICVVP